MDIAGISMAMSQSNVMEQASISVVKIAMDTEKESAQAMTDMLEMSADPNVGQHIDTRV